MLAPVHVKKMEKGRAEALAKERIGKVGLADKVVFMADGRILEEGKPAVDRYVSNFLCGGCSKDPIDLLAAAGVDMSTPQPVEDALTVFEEYLEQFTEQMNAK